MKNLLFLFSLLLWPLSGHGYSNHIVITDSLGTPMTICKKYGTCTPTTQGAIRGYSNIDFNTGGGFDVAIDHIDGSKTRCDGFNCIKTQSDILSFHGL